MTIRSMHGTEYLTQPAQDMRKAPHLRALDKKAAEIRETIRKQHSGSSASAAEEDYFDKIGLGEHKSADEKKAEGKKDDSEVGDFMKLFLTQLQCQNPLEPTEGADFIAQLAQFNSVEQLQKVNKNIQDMATSFRSNRIIEATSLIGKSAKVATSKMQLKSSVVNGKPVAELVKGVIKIPKLEQDESITEFKQQITNDKGEVIYESHFDRVKNPSGLPALGKDKTFEWDALDDNGQWLKNKNQQPIVDGTYKISAQILVNGKNGSSWLPLETIIDAKITSVSVNKKGEVEYMATGIGTLTREELKDISSPESSIKQPSMGEALADALQQISQRQQAEASASTAANTKI